MFQVVCTTAVQSQLFSFADSFRNNSHLVNKQAMALYTYHQAVQLTVLPRVQVAVSWRLSLLAVGTITPG